MGNQYGLAGALGSLGNVDAWAGNLAAAKARFTEALALARAIQDTFLIAWLLGLPGETVYLEEAEYALAQGYFAESLALFRELSDPSKIAWLLADLGTVAVEQGDAAGAATHYQESLRLAGAGTFTSATAMGLTGMAAVAVAADPAPEGAARAACLLAVVEAGLAAIGQVMDPAYRPLYARTRTAARAQLDEATWAAAWAEGRAMSVEQALAYAREPGEPTR